MKNLIKNLRKKNKTVAYLPQQPHLFKCSIRENISLFQKFDDETLKKILSQVNLNFNLDDVIENISRGQLQRLSLARCLLFTSPIMIFDEPTAAIDIETKQVIIKIICELRQNIIFATHDFNLIDIADDIINLDVIN